MSAAGGVLHFGSRSFISLISLCACRPLMGEGVAGSVADDAGGCMRANACGPVRAGALVHVWAVASAAGMRRGLHMRRDDLTSICTQSMTMSYDTDYVRYRIDHCTASGTVRDVGTV